MAYLNKVMIIGNLGKEPEIRVGQTNSTKKASLSVATSRRYKDRDGEMKETTTWHNVVAWGKLADTMEKLNPSKGTVVYIEGELVTHSWVDENAKRVYRTEINASNIQLLSQKSNSYAPKKDEGTGDGEDDFYDDVPF